MVAVMTTTTIRAEVSPEGMARLTNINKEATSKTPTTELA